MRCLSLLLIIPALMLAACGPGESPAPAQPGGSASPELATATPAEETTLTVGMSNVINTLDPIYQVRALDGAVFQQIMEPLVWYNDDLEIIPWLAESWEADDEGRIWTFHLKEGISYHCGVPFNADAVVAHFRRILDTPGSTRRNRIVSDDVELTDIEASGEHTVRFILNASFARWPELMRDPFAHIPCPVHAAEMGEQFTESPCGTGPFIFEEWRRGVRIAMRRNPDWQQGEILFDRLVLRPIPEETVRLIELMQGRIDISDVSWASVHDLMGRDGIAVQTTPSLSVRYIPFNTQKPPFDDVRVRRAANYAVNQAEIVEHLLNGMATVSRGPLPEVLPDYNPDVRHYDYNPDMARELLAEAGYPDGIDVVMWASTLETFSTIATAVVEDLRQVGIRVDMRVFDHATYWDHFDRYIQEDGSWDPQGEGVYDMSISGWLGGESPFGYLWPLLRGHSSSNSAFYDNPEVNAILYEMVAATDPADYSRLVRECQAAVVDDAPWLFCNHGLTAIAMRDWVEGYQISPSEEYRFSGVRLNR